MKVSAADLADRCSILKLKCQRLPFNRATADEWRAYDNACIEEFVSRNEIYELHRINGLIWDEEAAIRQGREGLLGLEEVGRRALLIRDLNRERIAIKNRIAAERGEFQEVKKDHASELAYANNAPTVTASSQSRERGAD